MSASPPQRVDSVHDYYLLGSSPTVSKSTPSSKSGSSTSSPSSRALVRTKTGELHTEQRPRLVSHPSGDVSGHGCKQKSQSEDDEEGSMVLVRVPMQNVVHVIGSNADDSSKEATGQLVKTAGRVMDTDEKCGEGAKGKCWEAALDGLTKAMKLESHLLLLKRQLNLYQAFDDASGQIFRQNVHDKFFHVINRILSDVGDTMRAICDSVRGCRNQHLEPYLSKHLATGSTIIRAWNKLYDFLYENSNKDINHQKLKGGKVTRRTWEKRRRVSMDIVDKLLRLLADVEMDEGISGILNMQNVLRKQWKVDGMIEYEEAEKLGWVCGIDA